MSKEVVIVNKACNACFAAALLLAHEATPALQRLLKVECCHGVSLGSTKEAEQERNTWHMTWAKLLTLQRYDKDAAMEKKVRVLELKKMPSFLDSVYTCPLQMASTRNIFAGHEIKQQQWPAGTTQCDRDARGQGPFEGDAMSSTTRIAMPQVVVVISQFLEHDTSPESPMFY